MMKKTGIVALFATAILGLSTANAAVSGYASTQHPIASVSEKLRLHPPTDITVINASASPIYAVVPNSPVNDYLRTGQNDHIYNYDPNLYWTFLVLQDTSRSAFYSYNVCKLAIVTVYGYTGRFTITTDSDLCN